MVDQRTRDSILQVRDEAARLGTNAFFTLHREQSHLLRLGNNSVSLNTSEDLTRLDVEVLDGRRQSGYTLMGDIAGPATVRTALDRAVAQTAVAVPKDYDPIAPAVEQAVDEQPQYDAGLERLDPAVKVDAYARVMEAVGQTHNYSGAWSSGSTELFLAGTASPATAWHLGTDQHFTCVLKHPRERWELASNQTGWRVDQVTAQDAIDTFQALLPVYRHAAWRVEPGAYTIAFGPWAIAEILGMAMWAGFTGRGYEEKLGWTAGKALGERILSERVTVIDDPTEARTFQSGFDGAGLTRKPFALVRAGTLAGAGVKQVARTTRRCLLRPRRCSPCRPARRLPPAGAAHRFWTG
jgi:predicted Zn-dependent protease